MPLDPATDPNEAYEVTHPPGHPHDIPADWWTVKCNGVPVKHIFDQNEIDTVLYGMLSTIYLIVNSSDTLRLEEAIRAER